MTNATDIVVNADEQERVQKKTFTKWLNAYLQKVFRVVVNTSGAVVNDHNDGPNYIGVAHATVYCRQLRNVIECCNAVSCSSTAREWSRCACIGRGRFHSRMESEVVRRITYTTEAEMKMIVL